MAEISYATKTGNPALQLVVLKEYASNNGSAGTTANTVYTTGTVAGELGSIFPAVNSVTASGNQTVYAVEFSDAILSTDEFSLEYLPNGSYGWAPIAGSSLDFEEAGNNTTTGFFRYGMRVEGGATANRMNVVFGNGGAKVTGAEGTVGQPWSDYQSAGWKWRLLRKRYIYVAQGVGISATGPSLVSGASQSAADLDLGTLSWSGTAPSGTIVKKYRWTRVNGVTTFQFYITASIAGAGVTNVLFTLPADAPVPTNQPGLGSSSWAANGFGFMDTGKSGGGWPPSNVCALYRDASNVYTVRLYNVGAGIAAGFAMGTIVYY